MTKRTNTYDNLVENLIQNLKSNENSHLLIEGEGLQLFTKFTGKIAEFYTLKKLFIQYYIPATNRASSEDLNEYKKSKYQSILNIEHSEFRSNYYELIRLGYVALFHKIESFINELVDQIDAFYLPVSDNNQSVLNFTKEKFDYGFKDWKSIQTISKINWITNCIKHYDGLPKKVPIHPDFIGISINERIKIEQNVFKQDIDSAINFCNHSLTIAFLSGALNMVGYENTRNESVPILELINQIKVI